MRLPRNEVNLSSGADEKQKGPKETANKLQLQLQVTSYKLHVTKVLAIVQVQMPCGSCCVSMRYNLLNVPHA